MNECRLVVGERRKSGDEAAAKSFRQHPEDGEKQDVQNDFRTLRHITHRLNGDRTDLFTYFGSVR